MKQGRVLMKKQDATGYLMQSLVSFNRDLIPAGGLAVFSAGRCS